MKRFEQALKKLKMVEMILSQVHDEANASQKVTDKNMDDLEIIQGDVKNLIERFGHAEQSPQEST